MILYCGYEELQALTAGAEAIIASAEAAAESPVAAPPAALASLRMLLPRLIGDLSIDTFAEQRRIREAVAAIHDDLHARLDQRVVESGPASEESVGTYFDYAHVGIVLERLDAIGAEMEAMIELMTGEPPTRETAAAITFPD
ncbi:hypothetical protein BH20GEM2_BH20GEM2_16180 [soil metagenome]|jgi:hypothetical protein